MSRVLGIDLGTTNSALAFVDREHSSLAIQLFAIPQLTASGKIDSAEERYALELKPGLSGRLDYRIRIYPRHEALTHPFETGLTRWV